MNLENLRCFMATASCRSLTKAAEKLYLTQSTLSRKLSRLEEELGAQLIVRDAKVFYLTEAGETVFRDRQHILQEVGLLKAKVARLKESANGTLSVGCYGLFDFAVIGLVKRYLDENYPGIQLELYKNTIYRMRDDIAAKTPDLLFSLYCELPGEDEGYVKKTAVRQSVVAILPYNHPLASRNTLNISDLREEKIIFWERYRVPKFYEGIVEACRAEGFAPNIVEEHTRNDYILMSVLAEKGITLLFDKASMPIYKGLVQLPVMDVSVNADVAYAYKKENRNPALNGIVEGLEILFGV